MKLTFEHLPVRDLGKAWGPKLSPDLVRHISEHGVLTPLLVARLTGPDGEVTYRIVDGNRRVMTARKVGLDEVPAVVIEDVADEELLQLTLAANSLRGPNPVTEYWALDDLLERGVDRQAISRATGITAATIKKRSSLQELDTRIFAGLARGEIATTVAEAVAKLPVESQRDLGDRFEREGRLLTPVVEEERKRLAAAAKGEPSNASRQSAPVELTPEVVAEAGIRAGGNDVSAADHSRQSSEGETTDPVRDADNPSAANGGATEDAGEDPALRVQLDLVRLAVQALQFGWDESAWIDAARESFRMARSVLGDSNAPAR